MAVLWLAVLAGPLTGQDPAAPLRDSAGERRLFDGAWNARWAQAVRTFSDGSMEIERWGDGSLAIDAREDRVTATWTTDVRSRVRWTLEGGLEQGMLRLRSTGHDSTDPELDIVERLEITVRAVENELEGTIRLHFRGRPRPPSERPISAVRAPSGGPPPTRHH